MTSHASEVLVMGVDGGGTRSRLVVADRSRGVLARSEGGPGLLGAGRDEEVASALLEQMKDLLDQVGGCLPVGAICVGVAGAGSEGARTRLGLRLREWGVARKARVVTDAEVAFADAFGEGPGILLIAGTGSVALARGAEKEPLRRVGGWGSLLGDEGSGYQVGLEGLRAAIRGAEDRGPRTALTEALLQEIEIETLDGLLSWSRVAGKSGIAALTPAVARIADGGDPVAEDIVSRAVRAMEDHVRTLGRGFPQSSPPSVALVGGLIEEDGSLRDRALRRLEEAGFHVLRRSVDPARGAVRMALTL